MAINPVLQTGLLNQSSAQIIDGSLKFNEDNTTVLDRTDTRSAANAAASVSVWVKRSTLSSSALYTLLQYESGGTFAFGLTFYNDYVYVFDSTTQDAEGAKSDGLLRDVSSWYHIFYSRSNGGTDGTLYINGVEQSKKNSVATSTDWFAYEGQIGYRKNGTTRYYDGFMSQLYVIDGQQLSPSDFGFTDPLTNTWRPKKYTGTFGTTGFYLPMDGNSPIGEDKSGVGNNWTPVNFGGSNSLEKATGALPILNTTQGGTQAGVGVFGSKENKYYTVTTANGSVYQFDITSGDNPSLSFIRGATYKFDYSSHAGHPVLFSSTNPDSSTTAYTTGTSIASNVISFTVPHDAPPTLYYYCSAHPTNMNGAISVTTDETKADKYAANCTLALPLVGSNSDLSNFINSTSTTKVMTNVGNAAASSDTSNFYDGSFEFDGSGDGITTPTDSDFDFGSGEFTIECWVKQDTTNAWRVFVAKYGGSGDREFYMGHNSSGKPVFIDGGGTTFTATNFTANTSSWYHMACVREGDVTTMYINGVCEASGASSTQSALSNKLTIGFEDDQSSSPFNGYLQDVRIYKGVAKYSGTTVGTQYFVPAATSPDILPDTPSGVSGSSELTKITEGAVSFDDSGDYLSLASSSDFTLSGEFTIECYAYCGGTGKGMWMTIGEPKNTSAPLGFEWYHTPGSSNSYRVYGNNGYIFNESNTTTKKVWHHVAISRDSSNNLRIWRDGKQIGNNVSDSNTYQGAVYIGAEFFDGSVTDYMDGFISNFRFINGTCLYTSNFTPPTSPLTNVTNTKLLCCQSNTQPGAAAVSPNVSGINNGTVWSSLGTGADNSPYRWEDTFDGNSSTYGAIAPQNSSLNLDLSGLPGGGLSYSSSVVIVVNRNSSAPDLLVNGVAQSITANGSDTTHTISGSGTLTSIGGQLRTAAGSGDMGIKSITVDGVALVDPVTANGNAAPTNFNPFNTNINTVRGQETGYCTMNPLDQHSNIRIKDGNLVVFNNSNLWCGVRGTFGNTSGKFYYEVNTGVSGGSTFIGLGSEDSRLVFTDTPQNSNAVMALGTVLYCDDGQKIVDSSSRTSYGDALAAHDLIGVAYDLDNKTVEFFNNGISQGVIDFSSNVLGGVNQIVFPYFINYYIVTESEFNFGQKPFKFSPPEGFQPLNLANIRPETVISRPDKFVGAKTFAIPSGGSGGSVTLDNDFDMVWTKNRTNSSTNHVLQDSVRGYGDNKNLHPNLDVAQTSTQNITAVNGRTLTIGSNSNYYNNNVAWSWKAGGNKNTFNIDDVGYANASDVGMNVGGQNSNAINQDQLWSGLFTLSSGSFDQAISNAFNGVISSSTRARTSGNAVLITMSLSTPVTVSSQVKVISEPGYDSTCTVTVGGTTSTSSSGSTHTFNVSGSLTQMTLVANGGSGRTYMEGMEIDGKLLVDSNVSINVPSIAASGASVGTKQGFSIIKYNGSGSAGDSVPHGLTEPPKFIITKNIDSAYDWRVFTTVIDGTNDRLFLNATNAQVAQSDAPVPTSSVFYVGANLDHNKSGDDIIAYLWHDVPGLQKFGSFEGNGNVDGPFVELGFKPSLILLKNVDNEGTGYSWSLYDNARGPTNPNLNFLCPDSSNKENRRQGDSSDQTDRHVDFLSNGFKMRASNANINLNAHTIFYAAWAEAPTVNLFGASSNAR